MERNTPIKPTCISNINAKKLLGFLYTLFHVEINTNGNDTAVSRQSICPIPSSLTEKLAIILLIQFAWNCRYVGSLKTVNPSIEPVKVINEENKAQARTVFSSLKKNAAKPLTKGITNRKWDHNKPPPSPKGVFCHTPLEEKYFLV